MGGIYTIRNTKNGKVFLDATPDITAAENRFRFAQQTGSCINIKLNKDWSEYGGDAFAFEVAEKLEKNDLQTPTEFRQDIQLLKKLWIEKYDPSVLY